MRRGLVVWLLVTVLAALVWPAGQAAADSAPIRSAGVGLQPVESTTVRMASERIEINVQGVAAEPGRVPIQAQAQVRVLFHFVPGADETMQAGFPLNASDNSRRIESHPEEFSVLADGKPLPFEQQTVEFAGARTPWAVWKLAFVQGKPLDLEVRYRMLVSTEGKHWGAPLNLFYLLQTGRFWAGTIGKAEAVVRMDRPLRAEDVAAQTTKGWTLQDGALHWTWTDLEPDANSDLQVMLANPYWLDLGADAARLVQQPQRSRAEQLRLLDALGWLFRGPGRDPDWLALRGGRLSGEVAEELWPKVQAALAPALAANPPDQELHARYQGMLRDSFFRSAAPDGHMVLYSPERLRLYLAGADPNATLYAFKGDAGWLWTWLADSTYKASTDATRRQQDLAAMVQLRFPAHFASEQAARTFVAHVLRPHEGFVAPEPTADFEQDVLQAALARVQAVPVAVAPADPGAPAAPPAGDATVAPAPPDRGRWAGSGVMALGGAALLALAYVVFRRRRR